MERTFTCNCTTLRYAAQTLTEAYERALAPTGLKITQFVLLDSILRGGSEQSITDLAQKLGSDRSTIGRNVRILVRDGLVATGVGSDRREHVVHITAKGRETVSIAYPLWRKAQEAVTDTLGQEQLDTLRTLLSQLEKISI